MRVQRYDETLDGKSAHSDITPYKHVMYDSWLACAHRHAPEDLRLYGRNHRRTITLDLCAGDGVALFNDWFSGSLWGISLRHALQRAASGVEQIVIGNEVHKTTFASLKHETHAALDRRPEVTEVSDTEWHGPNLTVRIFKRDSTCTPFLPCGSGDLVIVSVDGNTIDQSAKAVNRDQLVGLTQRGATVVMFTSLKTQTPAKMLPWEEDRINWARFIDAIHYSTVPSLRYQDTVVVTHRGFGRWIWIMTAFASYRQSASFDEALLARCGPLNPRQGGRNGQLEMDVFWDSVQHQDVQQVIYEAITRTRERIQIERRRKLSSAAAKKAHATRRKLKEEAQ